MAEIKTMSVEVQAPLTHGACSRRRRRASARHGGVDVELQHHVVPGLHPGRPPQHVPRGPPERAGAADHRELPDARRDVVPANHGDGAAVVGPTRDSVSTTVMDTHSAGSLSDASVYVPCARPTGRDAALAPSVRASSITVVSPKWEPGITGCAGPGPLTTCTAVWPGPPVMSCM